MGKDAMKLIHGHALDVLAGIAADSVHCIITSPPYYGLRSYKIEPVVWGGDPECPHEWGATIQRVHQGGGNNGVPPEWQRPSRGAHTGGDSGNTCPLCGAWQGHLGMEPTVEAYIEHLVAVFREVKRVLRPDGVAFINLADSYAGERGNRHGHIEKSSTALWGGCADANREEKRRRTMNTWGRPESVEEALKLWDAGECLLSVSMGGIGPEYEQAIQTLAFELLRDCKDKPLPVGEWGEWGNETLRRLSTLYGFSGAQVGGARSLAYILLTRGWASLDDAGVRHRLIVVRKSLGTEGITGDWSLRRPFPDAQVPNIVDGKGEKA